MGKPRKGIKAQLYIQATEALKAKFEENIDKMLEDYDDFNDCNDDQICIVSYIGELKDEEVICFEVVIKAQTFNDANFYYKQLNDNIKNYIGKRPIALIKAKVDYIM